MNFCRTAGRTTLYGVVLALFSTSCVYRSGKTARQSSFKRGGVTTTRIAASKPGLPDAIVDNVADGDTVASQYYSIKNGDTLAELSRRFYGDAKFWKAIYQANRDVIRNPNALEPGVKIRLP